MEEADINQIITEVNLNGDYDSDEKERHVVQPQGAPFPKHSAGRRWGDGDQLRLCKVVRR